MTVCDSAPRPRRFRDRWWFWPALGFAPLAAIVAGVWVTTRPISYVDGLVHLDRVPCDDGSACVAGLRLDGAFWPTECRTVAAERITDDRVAQGPGGRGFRIADVDPSVAIAVRDAGVCEWLDAPILIAQSAAIASTGLSTERSPTAADC